MTTTPVQQQVQQLGRLWWLLALFGVATFGVGMFFVISPHESLKTFTVIAGIFLLVDGVLAIAGAVLGSRADRALLALVGVLSAIAGLVLIKRPFETLVLLTLIVGIWFVVAGGVRLAAAGTDHEARGANLALGALDLAAGIVILAWSHLSLATFAVIVGITLLLRGALLVAAGLELRRMGKLAA